VWRLGARIVFADIDPVTYNIDPRTVAQAITPATKAVIPVHLFGQCADMDPLCELAARHDLTVIEDAAQAIGARYHGRPAGSLGTCGCFSFYPTKNLGGCGDGGMLTTSDDELAQRLRLLRGHGMHPRYCHHVVGINSRLDAFQAAALRVKLPHLAARTERRREIATRYRQYFTDAGLDRLIQLPTSAVGCDHVWNQYTIRIPNDQREPLRRHLSDHGIGSEVYYPVPLHLQPCFHSLGYREGSLPHTEQAARDVLSLPVFPTLTNRQQQAVVARIADFFHPRPPDRG
jgi:dTDP-4-amino-4,6-dideoxygalactose transaminase